jgi:FKBP-type peptidyl-prolyl cis-trans isomerase FklB
MKKWLFAMPLLWALTGCGETEEVVEEPLVLETSEDRLGYVLGSLNAQSILNSGIPMDQVDKDAIIEGFIENLNEKDCSECQDILMKFLGPYGTDLDTNFRYEGSKCFGRQSAFGFYKDIKRMGGMDKLNLEMVKAGFKHGVNKTDTLIEEKERRQMVGDFIMGLNMAAGNKMMDGAKKLSGAQSFDNGVVIVTLEEGKGGSPGVNDDVQVEYILTNAYGDTIESSFMRKEMDPAAEPVAFNLNGVIPGWGFSFPKLKKGGKYRLFIPWDLAYGEQGGKESLCFYVELLNYGPAGTLAKPQMPAGGMPQ